jgi:membrane-associated protease RseP (regulator of RpoE activity)
MSELRELLRKQTVEELAVAAPPHRPNPGNQQEDPPLDTARRRKRVTLEISGFDPDAFTDALDEDDEYDETSDGSSNESDASSVESDDKQLAPHQRVALPGPDTPVLPGTRVVWNGWAATVLLDHSGGASVVRIAVHMACPVEMTEMLEPLGGNPREVDCARSDLAVDPLPAGSMQRHTRSVQLNHLGERVGLKLASVGVKNWVCVTKVMADSPAETAGLMAGDYILEVVGKTIDRLCWESVQGSATSTAVSNREMEHQSGSSARRMTKVVGIVSDEISRQVASKGRSTATDIVVARHATLTVLNPDDTRATYIDLTETPSLGFKIDDVSCRVAAVTVGGASERQGLRVGASIIEVAGTPVGRFRADLIQLLAMTISQQE